MKKSILVCVAILAGCASNSGVVAMGQDTYFVSRQSGNALAGMANLKAEAIGEASQFCGSKGKALQVTSQKDAEPPFILGNYPKTEIQFKCT
ncbi:hypothetical protein [Massilia sp. ZL223]|uniref:hypothetical protein n=1 Tax=Massilia sp. ZL223 TaxID=2824904 RepID=UPI001B829E16|nr:hypothetical protein [Massilia sp. ZL223]MBQ5963174.1 hypothetical protein [Massilia sp. ZL223]